MTKQSRETLSKVSLLDQTDLADEAVRDVFIGLTTDEQGDVLNKLIRLTRVLRASCVRVGFGNG